MPREGGGKHPPEGTRVCSSPQGKGTAEGRKPGSLQPHHIFSSPQLLLQHQCHLLHAQKEEKKELSQTENSRDIFG